MQSLQLVDEKEDKIAIKAIKKPIVEKGQVLIKLTAAALNHRDQWCRQGMYPNLKYGTVLGSDGVGIVEEIGDGVDSEWMNQSVIINPNINWGKDETVQSPDYHILGMPTHGTFAEYVVVNQDRIFQQPKYLKDVEAAALPLGGLTAFRAVYTKAQVTKGQKVLITGIGGGVAQFAFQMAMAMGAEVTVTSGDEYKLQKAKEMGATHVFNYKEEGWSKAALKTTGGFDAIIDSAGGKALNDYIKMIKPGGRIVHYGSTTGMPDKLDLFKLFWSQASIHGTSMGSDTEFGKMIAFVTFHKIVPIIDSVRPFDQIVSAFDDMYAGKQFGKLVVEF